MKNFIIISRKILVLLAIFCLGFLAMQDETVDNLPAKSSLSGAATEYFYLLDNTTDKHFTGLALVTLIGDTASDLRDALADTALDLRAFVIAEASGAGLWIPRYYIGTPVTTSYTIFPKYGSEKLRVHIGSDPGMSYNPYNFRVIGVSYFSDTTIFASPVKFGTYTQVYDSASNQMWFKDINGKYSLDDLTQLPSTLSENWTLDAAEYNIQLFDDSYGFAVYPSTGLTSILGENGIILDAPYIYSDDSMHIAKLRADQFSLDSLAFNDSTKIRINEGGLNAMAFIHDDIEVMSINKAGDGYGYLNISRIAFSAVDTANAANGVFYVNQDDNHPYFYADAQWYDLTSGSGGGEVDTNGTPVTNRVAIFYAANKIGTTSNFLFSGDGLEITVDSGKISNEDDGANFWNKHVLNYYANDGTYSSAMNLTNENNHPRVLGYSKIGSTEKNTFSIDTNWILLLHGTDTVLKSFDSLVIKKPLVSYDSVYLPYITNCPTPFGIVYFDSTYQSIKVDSIWGSKWGLKDELIPLLKFLSDTTKNGELKWRYFLSNGTPIIVVDWNKLTPGQKIACLQWGIEHSFRYSRQLEIRMDSLQTEINDINERLLVLEQGKQIKTVENTVQPFADIPKNELFGYIVVFLFIVILLVPKRD